MKILAKTYRGDVEDLYTHGSIAVVDSSGKLIYEIGDSSEIAFARSTAKLMQAMSLLTLDGVEKFNFNQEEIATICASHSGEEFHIKTVSKMLEKIGLDKSYLKCGAHLPFNPEAKKYMEENNIPAEAIHNNCSGKHTGMLATAVLLGADLDSYYKIDSPVQKRILETIAKICDIDKDKIEIGVDGCGVPVHAMPLKTFAYGMARMGDPESLPEEMQEPAKLITESISNNPVFTSGSDRIDYHLIEKSGGKMIVKSGANGYYGGYIPEKKWGFAIKTYDGNTNNRNIVVVDFRKKIGMIDQADYEFFDQLVATPIKNHRGEIVGDVKAYIEL